MRYLYTILGLGFLWATWITRNLDGTGGFLCFAFAVLMWGFLALAVIEWVKRYERSL